VEYTNYVNCGRQVWETSLGDWKVRKANLLNNNPKKKKKKKKKKKITVSFWRIL
jgi:hypothetical protein